MKQVPSALTGRVMSADEAAKLIKSGMTVAASGFTGVGYPKMIPEALIRSGHADHLTICTGASVGDDFDGALVRAGLVSRRYCFQSNKDVRSAVNAGEVCFSDMHLSHFPQFLRYGTGPHIDVAVLECSDITEDGFIPAASVGSAHIMAQKADAIILELNETIPDLKGMHDIFDPGLPPETKIIPICHTADRIGTEYVPCSIDKVRAIVRSDRQDIPSRMRAVSPELEKVGQNVVAFLKNEIAEGRLPGNLGPIQSGVGSVGNAVLSGLSESGFKGLTMYTEVMQDAALSLIEKGIFDYVSASSISLKEESRRHFYENIDYFKQHMVLRPQDITNHPEVVRRLGLIALNTPIEADIYGNINSTHTMGTQIMNGIGGSGDFSRNARLNIFATESTAKGGLISCIVPMVSHVDSTEHDVQVIVTEQGVADLRWKAPRERAEILIENCAHPDFRPMLREYFEEAKKVSKGMHTPHDLTKALSWHQRFLETGSMKF